MVVAQILRIKFNLSENHQWTAFLFSNFFIHRINSQIAFTIAYKSPKNKSIFIRCNEIKIKREN